MAKERILADVINGPSAKTLFLNMIFGDPKLVEFSVMVPSALGLRPTVSRKVWVVVRGIVRRRASTQLSLVAEYVTGCTALKGTAFIEYDFALHKGVWKSSDEQVGLGEIVDMLV